MSTPWKPTLPVSAALVHALVQDQCPQLDPDALAYIGAGWDHAVWRCGDTLLRFPHQTCSSHAASRQVTALCALSEALPLSIPTPTVVGRATDRYPAVFVGYRWIDGTTPAHLELTTSDRARAAEPLARTLQALHRVPLETGRSWGLAPADRGNMQLRRDNAVVRAEQLADSPFAALAARAAAAMTPAPPDCLPVDRRVVHGDLHPGQTLFSEDGDLMAIIDWDDMRVGDPAFDLQMVWSFLPSAARPTFWSIYGDFRDHRRARHLALSYGLAILAQAVDSGRPLLTAEAAFGLRNALG